MPHISAFRGIRYDLGHVGDLSAVVAPPYDVIDGDLQNALYDRNDANVVRLILGKDQPGDDEQENRYARAGRLLRSWLRDGILFRESDPAIYAYHQVFENEGVEYTRRGFMCRTRLERFGKGNIHPHEQTHARAKADRLQLWQACRANLSQIFGLYPDTENRAQQLLETAIAGQIPLEATDDLGIVHRIWPVTDIQLITEVTAAMGDRPVYIADGHHRYETACNYRDQVAQELGGNLPLDHPANSVLMMCVSMDDPGMLVLPTHRLFRGLPENSSANLIEKMGDHFDCQALKCGVEETQQVWEEVASSDQKGRLAIYTRKDGRWTLLDVTDTGRKKLAEVAPEHSDDWRSLGVSLLHRLVIDTLLDAANLPAPKYVHSVEEVAAGLKEGDTAGRDATGQAGSGASFELAALVMPASLDDIRAISGHGERMPAKSTYFYPKLLSGLVINPLE